MERDDKFISIFIFKNTPWRIFIGIKSFIRVGLPWNYINIIGYEWRNRALYNRTISPYHVFFMNIWVVMLNDN